MRRTALPLLMILVCATPALAETSFQLSVAGAQAPVDTHVNGFRIGIFYAKNVSVRGFDLGILSLNEAENASGFSMNWGLGKVTGRTSGLASGFINFHTGVDYSLNAAFVNSVRTQKSGVNLGFINVTDGFSNVDISGIGISNESNVQVGFVNVTGRIGNLQIGFLNFAENGIFPVMPVFNLPRQ